MPHTVGRRLRVLVVDDDAVDRAVIRRALSKRYDLVEASSLTLAYFELSKQPLDCVLLDNRLPDGDALEMLTRLKREGYKLPVVVLTGQGHEELAVELLKEGAADYLTKSNSPERIESAVRSAIRWFRSEEKARLAEEALVASRELLATTLSSVTDAVITCDVEGVITYLNAAAEYLCVLPLPECLGQPLWEVLRLSPNQRSALKDRVESILRDGLKVVPTELKLPTADGKTIVVQERWSLTSSPHGKESWPSGVVVTFTDVTERRRNQERLEFLLSVGNELAQGLGCERSLQIAVDAAVHRLARSCLIAVKYHSGWIWRSNPERGELSVLAERLFDPEMSFGDQIARLVNKGELLVVPPRSLGQVLEGLPETSLGYTTWVSLETRHHLGVVVFESAMVWSGEELGLARDLVQRVALALDNSLLVTRLEESIRLRDEMIAIVSHDLRSPLNALALATDNLVDEVQVPEAQDYADIVQRAITSMNRLIQDLLDVETMASGRFGINLENCELYRLVSAVGELYRPVAEDKGLELEVHLPDTLPWVRADQHRLTQVLGNLLGNAIKFTDAGQVVLSLEVEPESVRLTVKDSGPGIAEEHLPLLFERFWRADRGKAGSGLGLAIVQGILTAHGSQVLVETDIGEGARFSFELPRIA